jgi:sorbitol/mannitol transport system permease protein
MTTTVEKVTETTAPATASKKKSREFSPWAVVAWLVGLGFFFPVFWMVLTAFKQEGDAATSPPTLFFTPTLDQFKAVFEQGIGPAMANSLFATGCSACPPRSHCRCGRSARPRTRCSSS